MLHLKESFAAAVNAIVESHKSLYGKMRQIAALSHCCRRQRAAHGIHEESV